MRENLRFPTRSDTNQAVQPQRMARCFRIYKVEGMHYACSEAIAQVICAFIFINLITRIDVYET